MITPLTPPRTELEERIALAYADGRGYTIERARRHVRNFIVQGPDSHHWDAVRPFAAQIIKPYWDGLLPLIRMAWNVLQPLLAEPQEAGPVVAQATPTGRRTVRSILEQAVAERLALKWDELLVDIDGRTEADPDRIAHHAVAAMLDVLASENPR